jgi:hypothetical protein
MLPRFHADLLADTVFGLPPANAALLASGLVLIFTINRWRKNTVTRRTPAPAAMPTANPLSLRDITSEVHALLADVEETARRLAAQIDNRYVRLEQLMGEADEKIRMLERLQNIQPMQPQVNASAGTPAARASSAHASEHASSSSDAQRALARLRQERGAPPAAQDPAYQPIYSLADAGKTPREIAQQLSRQPGEIELILALRQHA